MTTKQKKIEKLERHANREDISISERLHTIYEIYKLRGIPWPPPAEKDEP